MLAEMTAALRISLGPGGCRWCSCNWLRLIHQADKPDAEPSICQHLSASTLHSSFRKVEVQKEDFINQFPAFYHPLFIYGKCPEISAISMPNFKKKERLGSLIPEDVSAVSDNGWVTLVMSTLNFAEQSKRYSPAFQVDCMSLYLHIRNTSHQRKALWIYPICCKWHPLYC